MRAAISVIIPTLDAERLLPACAAGLFEGVQEGLLRELIVSDGGSVDETRRIADELGAEFVSAGPTRAAQLQRGAEAARGDWLLFVPPESQLQPGWTAAVRAHMPSQAPAVFRVEARGTAGRLAAAWANRRTAMVGAATGPQGLLVRAGDYADAGGHASAGRTGAPALARRLAAIGRRPVLLAASVRRETAT
ncbi:glycosyltransferase [Pseudooceanicola sediminis]|uniref:Glycosyltransferase n=1 Tax=Pseudooceanicola sediminis TaxID=2211117 RepID=A0A399J473_9RHOB|nr:glycosyltransferase [Pseudooceanicola sediminis]KAA2311464.1 glycosyltransferase [Puniceibacterium sp. HSS470]RII40071.1 glycosyltransferase [Pseudooceanicola sediminis]|tara:strand:+ start:11386 stop:11961 length:576 start_codon:yes stop_codon:yes gene_type:complete